MVNFVILFSLTPHSREIFCLVRSRLILFYLLHSNLGSKSNGQKGKKGNSLTRKNFCDASLLKKWLQQNQTVLLSNQQSLFDLVKDRKNRAQRGFKKNTISPISSLFFARMQVLNPILPLFEIQQQELRVLQGASLHDQIQRFSVQ